MGKHAVRSAGKGLVEVAGTVYPVASVSLMVSAYDDLFRALTVAEAFMSGFEGDEQQDGIDAKLQTVRAAIAKAEGRS